MGKIANAFLSLILWNNKIYLLSTWYSVFNTKKNVTQK